MLGDARGEKEALLVPGPGLSLPCRFSVRVNSTDLFHVDRRVWTTLKGRDGLQGPRERAFHTASVLGNYMVVYGEVISLDPVCLPGA